MHFIDKNISQAQQFEDSIRNSLNHDFLEYLSTEMCFSPHNLNLSLFPEQTDLTCSNRRPRSVGSGGYCYRKRRAANTTPFVHAIPHRTAFGTMTSQRTALLPDSLQTVISQMTMCTGTERVTVYLGPIVRCKFSVAGVKRNCENTQKCTRNVLRETLTLKHNRSEKYVGTFAMTVKSNSCSVYEFSPIGNNFLGFSRSDFPCK